MSTLKKIILNLGVMFTIALASVISFGCSTQKTSIGGGH